MTRALTRVPQQRPLSIFLFFLCVFSGCTYALAVHSHHESEALSQFTTWCPGFAALCTCLLLRIPLGTLGWGWPARRFLRLAYFLPLIYATPVYLLTWLVIRGAFSLLERNKDFAASQSAARELMPRALPNVKAIIIGCADMRVDPAHVLGIHPGEAVVMRNIGGRITPGLLEQLGMIGRIGEVVGAVPNGGGEFHLIVLQHTNCGITYLAARLPC